MARWQRSLTLGNAELWELFHDDQRLGAVLQALFPETRWRAYTCDGDVFCARSFASKEEAMEWVKKKTAND